MLETVARFFVAASGTVERTLTYDTAQYHRLIHMRCRFDERGTGEPLNFHLIRYQEGMRSNRRGFAHWYLKPKCGEEVYEVHYEGVLQKLSHSTNAGTLLDYERNWAKNELLNTGSHSWNFGVIDSAASMNVEKRLLEQRLERIGEVVTNKPDTSEFIASMETCGEILRLESAPDALPMLPLHAVPDQDSDPYSNHNLHWIFEFSGSVDAVQIGRGKHRIKRAV